MKIKNGVRLNGLKIEMRKVLLEADRIWASENKELVITSGLDGTHSAGSLHYYGYALDLRTRYFSDRKINGIASRLRDALGKDYDVVIHKTHIHVEFDGVLS